MIARCIGCGCTDLEGCEGGCGWLIVDRRAGRGVCSECPGEIRRFMPALPRVGNGGAFIRTVGGVKVKRCAGCTRDLPLSAFTLGSGPGGYHRHCRDCCRAARNAGTEASVANRLF